MSKDEAIHHDTMSTAATVGGKALKWGAIGAIAAFALPVVAGGLIGLLGGAAIGGLIGTGAASLLSTIGAIAGVVGGGVVGVGTAATYGGGAAAAGGLFGAFRGGEQVSKETAAWRKRGQGMANTQAKAFSDGEIKGVQEGYQLASRDMEPMVQQREQEAFQNGQKFVVEKIQEHMKQQMAAQAGADKNNPMAKSFADKHAGMQGLTTAEGIKKQKEELAQQQHTPT